MNSAARLIVALGFVVMVAVASACEGLTLFEPGQITVRNLSTTETAVLAVLGDDFKSYPTLVAGGNANVFTEVGGSYQVIVVMSAVDAQTYRSNLAALKSNLQKVVDGTASSDEKVKYFSYLAEVNAAVTQAQGAGGPSCSGKLKLDESQSTSVSVSVTWVPTLGSGSWSLSCGSN